MKKMSEMMMRTKKRMEISKRKARLSYPTASFPRVSSDLRHPRVTT